MTSDSSISRREFIAAASALGLAACVRVPRGAASAGMLVHVGSYTANGLREGIHTYRMDEGTGALRLVAATDAGPNPSWLALHPTRRFVYAVNETTDFGGQASGGVTSLAVGEGGVPAVRGTRRASRGGAPCHLSIDRTGRWALVANYVGGNVAVLPVADDGTLGDATTMVQHAGHGPNAQRQEGPHAHCIIPDPSNRFVLAADLGADRVIVYRFDERAGTLAAATAFPARPGSGPRHLAFHPNGRVVYVVNELALTLTALAWSDGALHEMATVPLLAEPWSGEATAAELVVAPSGRVAWASVRGPDVVVTFALDALTGAPRPVQSTPSGGRWPRSFALDPSERWMLVANQHSNDIVAFRVDDAGRLTPTSSRVEVPAPVCVVFAPG